MEGGLSGILSSSSPSPEEVVFERLLPYKILPYLAFLSPVEQEVLRKHYFDDISLASIGVSLNKADKRVSEIKKEAITKLRALLGPKEKWL